MNHQLPGSPPGRGLPAVATGVVVRAQVAWAEAGVARRGDDEVLVLAVADGGGQPVYASVLTAHPDVRAAADAELAAAGWVRTGPWDPAGPAPSSGPLPCTAEVRARPRVAVTAADQRSLDALRRLTAMARGPVTAVALVPQVAPRWQAAAALLRRLVEAGQVRCVGRTADRDRRPLYAPVGSPWAEVAPEHTP